MANTLNEAFSLYDDYNNTRATQNSGMINEVFVIDANEREIIIPDKEKLFGVYYDKDAERKYFQCPRYVGDNIDLSQCYIFVNYISVSGKVGQYLCDDVKVVSNDVTFTWLLSGNLFDENKDGFVWFAVMAKQADENGILKTVFNTKKAKGTVAEGIQADDVIIEEYADIIFQVLSKFDKVEDDIAAEVERYILAHPSKGIDETQLLQYLTNNQYAKKSDIPSAVTENTVSGWGFTKNTGTYSKPDSGIPESDFDEEFRNKVSKIEKDFTDFNDALESELKDLGEVFSVLSVLIEYIVPVLNLDGAEPAGRVWMTKDREISGWGDIPVSGGIDIKSYVYPETYGAIGDGNHDDTSAIQSAIDEASTSRKVVFLRNKNYKTTSKLFLKPFAKIVGVDPSKAQEGGTRIINTTSDIFECFDSSGSDYDCYEVSIKGINFFGGSQNHSVFTGHGNGQNVFGGTFHNLAFQGFDKIFEGHMFFTMVSFENITVLGCNEVGMLVGSECMLRNWNVGTGEANERRDWMLKAHIGLSNIDSVYFTGSLTTGKGAKNIMYLSGKGNTISNSWFDYCAEMGLYIENGSMCNVITGNMFRGCSRENTMAFLACAGEKNVISSNKFLEVHQGNSVNTSVPCVYLADTAEGNFIYPNMIEIANQELSGTTAGNTIVGS